MTVSQFNQVCLQYLIDPALALESPEVLEALKSGNDDAVVAALQSEF